MLVSLLAAGGAGAAIIVVNDSSDALHGLGCATSGTGICTLRDAITFATVNPGADEIHFAIFGSGVHTVTLDTGLPEFRGDLTIDGYTQPGSSPNTNAAGLGDNAVLLIEINGNGKGCFALNGGANKIRGLVINRCGSPGIVADDYSEDIPRRSLVVGNFIGVDAAGSGPLPNDTGVVIDLQDIGGLVIGGATPDARNLISGNRGAGVNDNSFVGPGSVIQGNFVGTDATGIRAVPNGTGIQVGSSGSFGSTNIADNLISGNAGRGVSIETTQASIHGNLVGTDVSGTLPLGNRATGVWLDGFYGPKSQISGNTIAFNGIGDPIGGGVVNIENSVNHQYDTDPTILGNSIFDNTSDGSLSNRGLGIDLVGGLVAGYGPGPNVVLCSYAGNPQTNFPILSAAVATGSAITLRGVLDGRDSRSYRIEFFASPTCDPSGYGEGKAFLGSTNVATDGFDATGSCNAAFDVTLPEAVPPGQYVTATATDLSTSEFSPCIQVEALEAPTVVIDGCDSKVPNALLPGGRTITDRIEQCAKDAKNHGAFVSCVSHLTNDLKKVGIITGDEKGAIQSCAGQARIP